MDKKCVIWGTGKVGQEIMEDVIKGGYTVEAYCDSNAKRQGKEVNNIRIIGEEELLQSIKEGRITHIIIGVQNPQYIEEIKAKVKEKYPTNIKCVFYREIIDQQENEFLSENIKKIKFKWEIDFDSQSQIWLDNFMSEVEYWLYSVAKGRGILKDEYLSRINNDDFFGIDKESKEELRFIKDKDIVLDIGCGLATKYGCRLDGNKSVEVIPIDPLSSFYNLINSKYSQDKYKKCYFGMFEFIANMYPRNYANAIIINNALDHCIDPLKSIIECMYILQVNGTMYMKHRRAEALFEKYGGLHRWNLDYANSDFILWNKENAVNVTEKLKDVAEVQVTHNETNERERQEIIVKIIKKKDFDLEKYIDIEKERYQLAKFIERFMQWTAEEKILLD